MAIYTLRTTSGREGIVIDMLSSKIRAEGLAINTVFHPAEIKGYIFVEGPLGVIQKAIKGVMHIRGLIEKPVKLEEIQHFLEYKKERIKVDIGDTVEIIGGPFKGEKGKINRIDGVKDEVTVELLEASIPIPVTIATEFVKVIKAAKKEDRQPLDLKPKEEAPAEKEEGPSELERAVEEIRSEEPKPAEKPEEKEKPKPEKPASEVEEIAKEAAEEAKEAAEEAPAEKEEPGELEKAMKEEPEESKPEPPSAEEARPPAEEKNEEETKSGGAAPVPEELEPPKEEPAEEEKPEPPAEEEPEDDTSIEPEKSPEEVAEEALKEAREGEEKPKKKKEDGE